ncbi:MAG: quaternary ammonium transporter, partial [Candidatus Eremiobacteraeota bacterium]|nr:quaternary ammonium transporter [Candidatus Eremiobacteraeota bacterium]
MRLTRARALSALAGGLVAGCGNGGAVKVGSKNFSEELFLGELYAQYLEKHGIRIERKFSLGSTQIAMAAMQRGELDLYPEYTGTALLVVLHAPVMYDARAVYDRVKSEYERRYEMTWLAPSPFNDTQALAATKATARRLGLRTLSDVSRAAPQLRLAVTAEFKNRPDGLPGLQRRYGGFNFKDIRQVDIGLRYQALLDKLADVTVAFSTDGEIAEYDLFIFDDDKHAFPPYQVAPVVRQATLQRVQELRSLDKLAPALTDGTIRGINLAIGGPQKREPADVVRDFLAAHPDL